jgi:hypothetical protein
MGFHHETLLTAIALAIVSLSAFGSSNPDYNFSVVALTGLTDR